MPDKDKPNKFFGDESEADAMLEAFKRAAEVTDEEETEEEDTEEDVDGK